MTKICCSNSSCINKLTEDTKRQLLILKLVATTILPIFLSFITYGTFLVTLLFYIFISKVVSLLLQLLLSRDRDSGY